ncbi:MAG: ribosome recycling factor, partial [Nitrospina sp.]|nr:ribosome recycling factor [Nitrospina sp.]
MADLIQEAEKKMRISIDHFHLELGKLRTGQASVALLDDLKVDYYGTPTPLKQVATLGAPDSQTLTIQPWEASLLKEIEKAIQSSDLGLTPNNDGKAVRLTIPPLTNERRQQLVKLVK